MQLIDLHAQQQQIKDKIDQRIQNVLHHGQFIMGPEVQQLEQLLSEYVGMKHCITCGNGTDALQLALMSQNIGQGDIVFTTNFSFFATAEVIKLVGATPWFVDTDSETYNICPAALETAIRQCQAEFPGKARAVIAVDLFGLPADYPEIQKTCYEHGLFLIEDAAQSFGASLHAQKASSFGDIACTSFFPAKPLGCYGDGGAVFTNDDETADTLRSLRVHGKGANKYDNVRVGLNSRLDTLQAAILLEKTVILDDEREQRNLNANFLNSELSHEFHVPVIEEKVNSAFSQYTLRSKVSDRNTVIEKLTRNNIPCAIYYDKTLSQQPAMEQSLRGEVVNSVRSAEEVFSIPVHAYLTEKELNLIVRALRQ